MGIEDDGMNYEAVEESEQPFLVGLIDKSKSRDTITLHSTPYYVVRPECYSSLSQQEEIKRENADHDGIIDTTDDKKPIEYASYSERLDALTASFGSDKKRKAMQTKLLNRLDKETLESAVGVAVEENKKNSNKKRKRKTSNGDSSEEEEKETSISANDSSSSTILPIPSKEAKHPSEIYPFLELFGLSQSDFDRFTGELATKFAT